MFSLVLFLVLVGACSAHYHGYDAHNLIEREEPTEVAGVLVECPVCENNDGLLPNHENCDISKGGKQYKMCKRGTYVNEVCGNRLDCYRGPGEKCSEKMRYDVYGQKCARGFYCNDVFHECTGLGYNNIDSNALWHLNKLYRYPLDSRHNQPNKAESALLLA
ncbi:uncharacterized protein [Epargyreus clarus]|uniref:uncharacterized protein n=1 Tax=Epargyreus clarus TaxID=520877 RepID=UPI003C2D4E2B